MSNPTETKQQYEGAILQQLVKNAETLAVIKFQQEQNQPKIESLEKKVDRIYGAINVVKWLVVTVGVGVIVNIISPPFVNWFN